MGKASMHAWWLKQKKGKPVFLSNAVELRYNPTLAAYDCDEDSCEQECDKERGLCTCREGHVRDECDVTKCLDASTVDPCEQAQCEQKCDNKEDKIECSCDSGFEVSWADHRKCQDIDECKTRSNLCGRQQTCKNIEGGYDCVCKEHFTKDPNDERKCIDVDECTDNPQVCGPRQRCINVHGGSHRCDCGKYFKKNPRNPKKCKDINECRIRPRVCGRTQRCKNKRGGYTCKCKRKSVKDPLDSKECLELVKCKRSKRSKRRKKTGRTSNCECKKGYEQYQQRRRWCIDINECHQNPGPCLENENCKNIGGGFECVCKKGFIDLKRSSIRRTGEERCIPKDEFFDRHGDLIRQSFDQIN